MAMPPAHEWQAVERGVACWRAHVTMVMVEPCGADAQARLLTVMEGETPVATLRLSPEASAHLAGLLAPQLAA